MVSVGGRIFCCPLEASVMKNQRPCLIVWVAQSDPVLAETTLAVNGSFDHPGVQVAAEKSCCGLGLLGGRATCQEQAQVVCRSRPAASLYRFVPVFLVKFLGLHKNKKDKKN